MMKLDSDYVLLAYLNIGMSITTALDNTLRTVPLEARRDRYSLVFVLSPDNHQRYLETLAAYMSDQAGTFLLGINVSVLNFRGIPVISHPDASDDIVEIYGPDLAA